MSTVQKGADRLDTFKTFPSNAINFYKQMLRCNMPKLIFVEGDGHCCHMPSSTLGNQTNPQNLHNVALSIEVSLSIWTNNKTIICNSTFIVSYGSKFKVVFGWQNMAACLI